MAHGLGEQDDAHAGSLVVGSALLLALLVYSAGLALWRDGFEAGNSEAAYRAARDAVAEFARLARLHDSITHSLVEK